ncbi:MULTISPECIES: lipid-A-disaccharide synthase N-terminal domain-containing protein [unclassified Anaerobiospirillum]|uniref:lipid-A-disaccharide synthase N-terminal domain-containing protein n=1 Tax=unclassified Anaerobiospirillum TaxID=2647410 RepID=UPI001FF4A710|nr:MULTISPECIES: lipid-A-disaccharide synthase N-terminal domain-containing protein [unclassified Anaerobiospirillum]MCK0534264.1 lipid-A-disaccharide synthase N-terminal domain-containing protein [Anaerobiospirillum sp. NML120511]MCK0539533.1 lipid-A-disaccharide synthase N-terminal domain-containing protein [Anaerobiospirillum sp. NML02-A-032]
MSIISWYTLIGLIAQAAFAGRMIVQWVMSEKAKTVVNPAMFWWLSLLGSFMMSFYGALREDFAILLAQTVSFYIYIYNLRLKRELGRFGRQVPVLIMLSPPVMIISQTGDFATFVEHFLNGQTIGYGWLLFGLIGQFLFSFRFVYQMFVSHRRKESVLPPAFWYISLMAAIMVQIYGIYRLDVVLILGQVGGMVTYVRNIMLHRRSVLDVSAQAADDSGGGQQTAVNAAAADHHSVSTSDDATHQTDHTSTAAQEVAASPAGSAHQSAVIAEAAAQPATDNQVSSDTANSGARATQRHAAAQSNIPELAQSLTSDNALTQAHQPEPAVSPAATEQTADARNI